MFLKNKLSSWGRRGQLETGANTLPFYVVYACPLPLQKIKILITNIKLFSE